MEQSYDVRIERRREPGSLLLALRGSEGSLCLQGVQGWRGVHGSFPSGCQLAGCQFYRRASLLACQCLGGSSLLPSGVPLQKGLGIASEFSGCQAWPKKQSKERPLGCRWPAGPRAGMCWHRTARRRWARSTPSGVLQERVVDSGR